MDKIKIIYKEQEYKLTTYKLINILKILENKNMNTLNKEKIIKLMEKYNLFDEVFLENINRV